ncbi:MAG: LLM class flavin-dependent oxidoreductase [Thermomicrobiales bacterium]|nr:LLM class flavin-dependent oxidoreductase [Thermomicrobiales bacterium]
MSAQPLGRWPASRRQMGFGVMMPVSEGSAFGPTPSFQDIAAVSQRAEQAGLDALWFADHMIMQTPPKEGDVRGVWEVFPLFGAVAAVTSTINIGTMVACLGWRNPGIMAKMVEMIDDISNGRFVLGVGAGWHEPEYEMFHFPWDHRVQRFEDAINIISPMLREGKADYRGEFWQATDAVNAPRGPRADEGGAPILFGTNGPRMLGLMAKFGDAWNTGWHATVTESEEQRQTVDRIMEENGRDPATLVKTVGSNIALANSTNRRPNPITGSATEIAERIQTFRDAGFRHMVVGLDPSTEAGIDLLAEVVALVDGHNGE